MAAEPAVDVSRDVAWQKLRELYPTISCLEEDAVYSLTEPVLYAIHKAMPGFFTFEQWMFEFNLAHMTGGGLFLRKAIVGPVAAFYRADLSDEERNKHYFAHFEPKALWDRPAPLLSPEAPSRAGFRKSTQMLRELLHLLARSKADPVAYEDARAQQDDEWEIIDRRSEAYAGWLVLNPQFRRELAELKAAHETSVTRRGAFPTRKDDAVADSGSEPPDNCTAACRAFYRRWCLDRLLTWDLPLPLEPHVHSNADAALLKHDEAVTVTLPWPALRGARLDVQKIIERVRHDHAPEHLQDWLKHGTERETSDGEISFQRLFWLYRIYELVLFRRYAKQCEGNLARLDYGLAKVMGRDEELVRKLRLRLMRERKDVPPTGASG